MKPVFRQPSPETDTDYAIYVEAPETQSSGGPLPAMLFMDGDDQFTYALAAYREVRAAGTVPPALLEQQIAAKPFGGLEITAKRFPHRDHFNVLPDAFRAGMT